MFEEGAPRTYVNEIAIVASLIQSSDFPSYYINIIVCIISFDVKAATLVVLNLVFFYSESSL